MAKDHGRIEAMTDGQRAYEARRAAKAGVSLEKWVATRDKARAEARPAAFVPAAAKKRPGLLRRLLARAGRLVKRRRD